MKKTIARQFGIFKYFIQGIFNTKRDEKVKWLLIKLLHRIEGQSEIASGLCLEIGKMVSYDFYTGDEFHLIKKYLDVYAPLKRYGNNRGFWFEPGQVKPRVEWINNRISKL